MAELARGTVGDRPWGRTLAALAARALTGQVSIICDGKLYQIVFEQGAIVGAESPQAADSAVRVALTLHLVSSTQVPELSRRQAANPNRDEIDIIADYARIAPEQAMRLRRRTIATRAARTFAIDHGDFVIEDQVDSLVMAGTELDVRAIIYMGAVQHLTEERLASELGKLGSWFQIKPAMVPELAQFGFTDAERSILEALAAGTALGALENSGVDVRSARAVVYALASAGACDTEAPQRPISAPISRIVQAPQRPTPPPVAQAPQRAAPPVATPMPDTFTAPRTNARLDSVDMPTLRRELPKVDAPTTRRPTAAATPITMAIQGLIAARLKLVDSNADHFVLLGVTEKSTEDQIRKAYFALARQLHPDRLASLGMTDDAKNGQRLFAQVNAAFGVLSDAARRAEYQVILSRGGEAAIRAEQAQADAKVTQTLDAEDAFHRGELALKRDSIPQAIAEFKKAVKLAPDETDYHTLLTWAEFCGASDKMGAAQPTRGKLIMQIKKSPQAWMPRFYLGRVERMLGRDPEALKLFESVLQIHPEHPESIAEVRVLRSRIKR